MSRKLPTITKDNLVRGMSMEVNDRFEEYLAVTEDPNFFFRIHEDIREEGNQLFVIGIVRRDRQPATWIDFPSWILLV